MFIADVVGPLHRRHGHEREVSRVCNNFARRRRLLYKHVAAALQSKRFRQLELNLARWIELGPWLTSGTPAVCSRRNQPVIRLAAKAIARRRKKLKKAGRHMAELNRTERHKLRIRAKKLRYAIEFFSALFPERKHAKRCRNALSALVDLQDSLGALNDLGKQRVLSGHGTAGAATGGDSLTETAPLPKALAAGVSQRTQGAHVAQLLRKVESAFDQFCAVKPFWKVSVSSGPRTKTADVTGCNRKTRPASETHPCHAYPLSAYGADEPLPSCLGTFHDSCPAVCTPESGLASAPAIY